MSLAPNYIERKSVYRRAAISGLAVVLCGVGAGQAAGAPILIDDFGSKDPGRIGAGPFPQIINIDSGATFSGLESGLSGTIGGVRYSSLGLSTMDVDGLDSAGMTVFNTVPFSFFDYNSTIGADATATLIYGSPPSFNLDGTGQTSLRIDFLSYDAPSGLNLVVNVDVFSSTGGGSFSLPAALVSTPGAQSINLSLAGLSAATRADLDQITISFVAPKAADFRIDTISLVPEPASAAVMLMAAAAGGLIRKPPRQR